MRQLLLHIIFLTLRKKASRLAVLLFLLSSIQSLQAQGVGNEEIAVDTTSLNEFDLNQNQEEYTKEVKQEEEYYNTLEDQWKGAKSKEGKLVLRSMPDTAWQRLRNDNEMTTYVLPKVKEEEKKDKTKKVSAPKINGPDLDFSMSKSASTILLYCAIALVILMIAYALVGKQYFSKKDKKIAGDDGNTWENVEAYNEWDAALNDATSKGDYRLATRIHFLQTLQKLSQANAIQYERDTLNATYKQQLYNTMYYSGFSTLVTYFDYIWYGEYPISATDYEQVKQAFSSFNQTIYIA